MKTIKETIPEIIAELEQVQALDRSEILEYRKRLSDAWRREKDATRSRVYRLNKKSRTTNTVTNTVTESVTNTVTNTVTHDKEERTEKENLLPTPPIREKGKKEEMPPAAATRASRVREDKHSRELVKERAEVSLKCRDFDRLPPIIEQIVKNGRNRKESIAALSIERRKKLEATKRFYDRGVRVLTSLISPNKIKG